MNSENFHKYAPGSEKDSLDSGNKPKNYSSYYFWIGVFSGWMSMILAIAILLS
jgi:hypothetical protein